MLKIAEYAKRGNELKKEVQGAFSNAGLCYPAQEDRSDAIRLVFAGQYSAGKSSILKMLTGRTDIAIGEGITTQETHQYDWNGLEVIDTPGIHTELRPDHDEIAYAAIASADMLVFVITNELFDPHIAAHFRKLAIDRDKAGEMILVVNKMERANDGNSPAQREIIREDLKKVLDPYTPEQLNLSFLSAESYLDGIAEKESDPESAEDLIDRSGYKEFVETLDRFVKEKHIPSKLTTELYLLDEQLDKVIQDLQPKSSDADIDALEESFLQQQYLFVDAREKMRQEVRDIFTSAASEVRNIGLDAANLLVEGCKQAEVEDELSKAIQQTEEIMDRCQDDAGKAINARLAEMGQRLEAIENSEISRQLKARLNGKFSGLPEGVQRVLTTAGTGLKKAGQAVLDRAYKVGAAGGLKLTNFSGSTIHGMVLKIGHSLGYKFKPWQAVKLTQKVAIGGQVLSAIGVVFTIFMQVKTDRDEERIREDLRYNRQNVRSQFNAAANELENFARKYIAENIDKPMDDSIGDLGDKIQEIRDSRADRSMSCRTMEDLQKKCRLLIQEIHSACAE